MQLFNWLLVYRLKLAIRKKIAQISKRKNLLEGLGSGDQLGFIRFQEYFQSLKVFFQTLE